MDDSKGAVTKARSLAWMLSFSICGTILLAGILGASASFWFAFEQARDLQDDELREIAQLVDLRGREVLSSAGHPTTEDEPEMRIWVFRTHTSGTTLSNGELSLSLSSNLPNGLHTVESGGQSWRLYSKKVDDQHGLAVAQRTSARDAIARDAALRTLVPLLIVMPVLMLLTAFLIRLLLRKVREVARQVDGKGHLDFTPVSTSTAPKEIVPFVMATNQLLQRVERGLANQRRFVSDAAHELRSPLAAMTLQLENAAASTRTSADTAAELAPLGSALVRLNRLVERMLTLSKLESAPASTHERIDGKAIVLEVIAELHPVAENKGVDLGLLACDAVTLEGSAHDFRAVVRNAVENAVLYTPPGGRVDIRLCGRDREVVFEVEDTGPGIPEDVLSRVFDPFFRVPGSDAPGSGLGLAIVRNAVERLKGVATLENIGQGAATGCRFLHKQALVGEVLERPVKCVADYPH